MAALVSSEGRLRVANQAFLLRALGEGDAVHYAGRDVAPMIRLDDAGALYFAREGDRATRSEEHTSELQSLMRNSYAVFFLKRQKHDKIQLHHSMHHSPNYDYT